MSGRRGGRWIGRARRTAAGVVTVGVVAAWGILGAHSAYPQDRPRLLSGQAWLASARTGQLTLVDGASAEVAARVDVAPAGGGWPRA